MNRLNKLLRVIAVIVVVLGIWFPSSADRYVVDGIYYDLTSDSTCCVVGVSEASVVNVTIPEKVTLSGTVYSVTGIGESAFMNCRDLNSATIPNSVTHIGGYAFSGCSDMTGIAIPNSVISIGEAAFMYCEKLTSVTIPNSITLISKEMFYGCLGLREILIPNSVTLIDNYAFRHCSSLTSVTLGNSVNSIGAFAFLECSSLTSVTIPSSVWAIGAGAFADCDSLTSIVVDSGNRYYNSGDNCNAIIQTATNRLIVGCKNTIIPNSVTTIMHYAFFRCIDLKEIAIPNSVTYVGISAFAGCSNLTKITIPNSVTNIDKEAFFETGWYLSQPSGVLYLDNCCLGYKGNLSGAISIQDGTRLIADAAFAGCTNLSEITIPNSVTNIGKEAFFATGWYLSQPSGVLYLDNCCLGYKRNLSGAISIQDGTRLIADAAFEGCTNLSDVNIPNSVTNIGGYVFYDCSGLASVSIGNSVTSIGDAAFMGCSGLSEINIPSSVTRIGQQAFSACIIKRLTIEDSSLYLDIGPSGLDHITGLESLYIGRNLYSGYRHPIGGIRTLKNVTIDGYVTDIGEYMFYDCPVLTSVSIGNSVTSIGNYAFDSCSSLISVSIGNSVTSIGNYAFDSCSSLSDVNIPNSVTNIGDHAFSDCSSLSDVNIPNSVTNIGDYAFIGCSSLTSIYIGNSVTNIGGFAFAGCTGLTSIYIGNSVTSIGNYAFNSCSSLTKVNISDLSAWCRIDFGKSLTNPLCYANHLYLNGTEITDLVIPDDIAEIKKYAFYGCSGLTSVSIPGSVTSIGGYAFSGCSGLTSVSIPGSVTSIGGYAFSGCKNIKELRLEDSVLDLDITDQQFGRTDSLEILYLGRNIVRHFSSKILKNVTIGKYVTNIDNVFSSYDSIRDLRLEDSALPLDITGCDLYSAHKLESLYLGRDIVYDVSPFSYKTLLKNVNIGDSVTIIGERAFYGCSGLTSISIGSSVTGISGYAFYDCAGLTSLTIPGSVTSIGGYAFSGCSGLTSVTIPGSVTSIGHYAFYKTGWYNNQLEGILYLDNCCLDYKGQLESNIALDENTRLIADYAFAGSNLKSVTIPNSVTSIGYNALGSCLSLTEIVVESGNRVYDSRNNCNAIIESATNCLIAGCKNTIIPNSVTSIGERAFSGCSNLTEITIPNSVANIGEYAFVFCRGLTSVSIGSSVMDIGASAFSQCRSLAHIKVLNPTPPICDGEIFSDYDCLLEVPEGCLVAYQNADIWRNFYNIAEIAGVEDILVDKHGVEEIERYDINGRRLTQPVSGINIIKMSDGSTRKEVIK